MLKHRRRRTVLLACATQILVALLGLVAVVAWASPSTGNVPAAGPQTTPTQAEIAALLARQSGAMISRDRSRFAAGLDSSAAAAGFRDEQLAAFDNIADVPLASWAETIDSPVTATEAADAATARLDADATIVKVQLAYALRDVDAAPTLHSLWLTFVHRDGRTVISSDSDLADAAGASWHGLWDFGKVDAYRGASSLVLAHPKFAGLLTTYAGVVDRAVKAVTAVWGSGWTQEVAVVIPDTQAEMSAVIGNDLVLDQIDAVSVADVDNPEVGQLLGQRVVLNPANLEKLSDIGEQIVVRHEVTLIATRPTVGSQMPTWLIEGFAEYVANLGSGQTTTFAAAELRREIRAARLPKALPTSGDFNSENSRIAPVYEESWLACRYIAERAGEAGLLKFYRAVAAAIQAVPAATPDQAVTGALKSLLGLSTAQFVTQWSSYLRAQLS
ncbi:hypothetical protein SAMN05892883_3566 [Jatrophihabitans sp. GAS493]|uniref:hypothetical protein n=1 Tax=Jatrophihabitans sp. GAS493 TaxID=1907575 RepID=UPI000BB9A8EB|nr:hypothetical protein [Jatrophihabitans sp. GAS493]SOD74382.1 hypothetical protein SAMN05892883_3566 [Jatrophihabitans sp. GAS493]